MGTVTLDSSSRNLLLSLINKVCKLDTNSDGVESILTNIQNILTAEIRTPGRVVYSSGESGNIAAGYRSFTVTNLGSTDALLDGQVLAPGQSNTFDAGGQDDTLLGMSYDAQATTLEIITVL